MSEIVQIGKISGTGQGQTADEKQSDHRPKYEPTARPPRLGDNEDVNSRTSLPTSPHVEGHFTAGDTVRDVVIGMSDGLTVPFALAAGLSGAVTSTGVIATAGIAEIVAGAIAMGLGGFLAARGDAEHYASERKREEREVIDVPDRETEEVREILIGYGVEPEDATRAVEGIKRDPKKWVDFMMRFELGLEEPDPKRALASAATIGGSYVVGGLIPLASYFLLSRVDQALPVSCGVTLVALCVFGAVKARFVGLSPFKGMAQTVLVGGLAATAAFLLARLFS